MNIDETLSTMLTDQITKLTQKFKESSEKLRIAQAAHEEKYRIYCTEVIAPFIENSKILIAEADKSSDVVGRMQVRHSSMFTVKQMLENVRKEDPELAKLQFEAKLDQFLLEHTAKLLLDFQMEQLKSPRD